MPSVCCALACTATSGPQSVTQQRRYGAPWVHRSDDGVACCVCARAGPCRGCRRSSLVRRCRVSHKLQRMLRWGLHEPVHALVLRSSLSRCAGVYRGLFQNVLHPHHQSSTTVLTVHATLHAPPIVLYTRSSGCCLTLSWWTERVARAHAYCIHGVSCSLCE